jgi:carbon storage regulator
MLVLSRRKEESIVVGGPNHSQRLLRVTVLEIGSEHVRLGFEADKDVPIHRSEVWERICAGGPKTSRRPQRGFVARRKQDTHSR